MAKLLRVYRCIVCGSITGCLKVSDKKELIDKKEIFSNCRDCDELPCSLFDTKNKPSNGHTGLCRICGNY